MNENFLIVPLCYKTIINIQEIVIIKKINAKFE